MAGVGDVTQTGPEAFFGYMGVACALVFANLGAAYGTAKSGVGISSMGVLKPELIIKSIIPVVMAGILGIYGLIVSVILQQKGIKLFYKINKINLKVTDTGYTYYMGFKHLASGLCCGLSSLVIINNFFISNFQINC
jgi:V-type H+-transporting ATPase proteolipid subunit